MIDLLHLYRAQFKTTIAEQFQYRGALVIWLTGLILEPVIFLSVWAAVARSQGGSVDGFTANDFAAYFLLTLIVDHAGFTWIMWEMEYWIRQGNLSPLLVRPVHPIIYTLVSGITQLVVRPSLQRFMEDVRLGTLDFTLTKPVDAQALVSMRQIEVWKLIDVVVGLVVLAVAMRQLGASVGAGQALVFIIALLAGVTIIYSFLLILATCAFWWIRLENILNIFQSMYEAGRWPIGIYPPWLRYILTFLVPVGFAITVPTEGLVGRLTSPTLLGAIALAVALPLIARVFWKIGVRHYSGASA